jgi:CBS domain-containing protein
MAQQQVLGDVADRGAVEPDRDLDELYRALPEGSPQRRQRLYPVLETDGGMIGALPWSAVLEARGRARVARDEMITAMAVAHPDEILRPVPDRMAGDQVGVLPVVDRADPTRLDGLITQFDLLRARQKLLVEERHAERLLRPRRVGTGPPGADRRATPPDDRAEPVGRR